MSNGLVRDPELIDPESGILDYLDDSPVTTGGAKLDSPYGSQLGAQYLQKPATRFLRVPMKAVAASANENLMGNTTDGRYDTVWHPGDRTTDQWIVYELASRRPFTHLILTPAGHKVEFNVRRWEFAVSDDGETNRHAYLR